MRLVEGVVGERHQDVPQRLDRGPGVAVGGHARLERDVLGVEDLALLLAHRLAQQVGLSEGVAGDLLHDREDLLLVDDQAVRRLQDLRERLLELGVDRRDLLPAVLAQGVVGVGVGAHRTGAVERQHGRDVGEAVGAHQPQQAAHRAAVELEDAEGVAAGEQLVGGGVVEGEVLDDHLLAAVALDVDEGVVEDGEVAQPQEVHLDQPEVLAHRVVELGDDRAVLGPADQRDDVEQRLARHDHAGGVDPPLALEALEADRGVDDGLDVVVGLVEGAELAALAVALVLRVEDVLERDVLAHHRGRHRLGDPVAHRERVAEDPAGVLDRLLGLDGAVGDDHRDAVLAVLLGDVADHLGASTLVEVDVEVGHRDALGVEEALEDQAVLERVEVGDPHRVGADRAGAGAAPGTDPDAVVLGPVDEVGDHQEVARGSPSGG